VNFAWRRFGALLLGLTLLLAQAGALAHGLEHSLEYAHHDDPACERCLAFAPLGGALASPSQGIDAFSQPGPLEAKPPRHATQIAGVPPYLSRAPPSRPI
jgi:hypothetical protein